MIIAQITDLHIGFPAKPGDPQNDLRLTETLDVIASLNPRPDLILATGDLTNDGHPEQYERLLELVADCDIPIHWMIGNHDQRAPMRAAFNIPDEGNDFVSSVLEFDDLRLVLLDSHGPGLHGGGFGADQADWLDRQLAARPDTATILAIHHSPIFTGISWMPVSNGNGWETRLSEAVAPHKQVKKLICGHVHRSVDAMWNDVPVAVCSSTAPQLAVNLTPIDADAPDERPLVVNEAPAFAIHIWNGSYLMTHHMRTDHNNTLVKFEPFMQHTIAEAMDH